VKNKKPDKTVLIVDDSKFIRTVIKRFVVTSGFTDILEAEDGEKAIEECILYNPSLIFLDINMPRCDGLKILRRLKKESPRSKVVIVSAIGQETVVKEAIKNGAVGYITKPFSREDIVKIVRRLMSDDSSQPADKSGDRGRLPTRQDGYQGDISL